MATRRPLLIALRPIIALLICQVVSGLHAVASEGIGYWPSWRGPLQTGVAPEGRPPIEWSETKNIAWKASLPGKGHSTPIVWGHRIFLTAAEPFGEEFAPRYSSAEGTHDGIPVSQRHRFWGVALDRRNGQILWKQNLRETIPHEGGHYTGSLASNSAVTDGERVYFFFGSYGLYCLHAESGAILWQRELGLMNSKHGHGEGASPCLVGDNLLINWDHEGRSFLVAVNRFTGEERWRVSRPELTTWSTPIVVQQADDTQVIVSGTTRIRAYAPQTGAVLWECAGLSSNVVASPVEGDGIVYAGSSYESRALLALRWPGAEGDITDSDRVVWKRSRGTPYVPSPLLYGNHLYFLAHYQGILTRVHGPTGEDAPGPIRLDGIQNVYASPVAANQCIYITGLEGTTVVVSHGDIPRILARNQLDDTFCASAAIAENQLLLRGLSTLYCISPTETGKP